MVKIVFGIIITGTLYYVLTPLLGRKVGWVDDEDPDDERMRELELTKKINLKALKDIEFELASGKINDEDYQELREHYSRKVSRIMALIEDLTEESEETVEAHHGGRGKKDPEEDDGSDEDEGEDELDEDEGEDEDDLDEDDVEDEDGDDLDEGEDELDEDEEYDEDDDEYEHRSVKGPILTVLALALAVGVGIALFQMGKRSSALAPTSLAPAGPVASQSATSNDQAGLEHLLKYVQENPWNVTSHIILGEYYLDAGNTNVALAHFVSAEGIKPTDGRVLSNLGKTYRKLGSTDQAIEKFRAAADAEPESLEHLYQLGLVYGYDKGNLTQALALFEEILSRQPDENLRVTVDEELRKLGLSEG